MLSSLFFFQAEDGIRDLVRSRGLGDVYKRQAPLRAIGNLTGWIEEDAGETLVPEARTHFNMIKQLSLIHI